MKLAEVTSYQMESYVSYSRKELDERCACSAGFTGRTPHYSSIIDYLLSLYDTPLAGSVVISTLCFGYLMLSSSPVSRDKKRMRAGSVTSEVSWDTLFMPVSWWCKSDEKLWDVLLKHSYVCRQGAAFSALRRRVAGISFLSTLSSVQLSDRVEADGRVIVSLSVWLWRPDVQWGEGAGQWGGAGRREACLRLATFTPHPVLMWCLSMWSALILLLFLLLLTGINPKKIYYVRQA